MKIRLNSIKTRLVIVFLGLIAGIMGIYLMTCQIFMERYYQTKKQSDMIRIYEQLNRFEDESEYISSDFQEVFQRISSAKSVDLTILSMTGRQARIMFESTESRVMRGRVEGYLYGFLLADDRQQQVMKTDSYVIQKCSDSLMGMDYLEAWGNFDNGCYFLMRVPMQAITESVKIAQKFSTYVLLAAMLISAVLIWWTSERITRPVKELTEQSRRMADLEFDVRYTGKGSDEIAQLGNHFNLMSNALEKTIAELKTANNELSRDLEKKQQIDEMRKEFLSNVSHELKTPIALIQGYSEGLKDCVNDDEESREYYCDVIIDEAAKMNNMVKKLLSLNHLESGEEVISIERFDLSELLRGVLQNSEILFRQKEAQVQIENTEERFVWGDAFRVEEVITNYLTNALNHLEGQRIIRIRTEQIGDKIRTTVFNTGRPIPQEEMEKLWGKFYKVDKARTREYGGSGIGLSIVKAIMESLHQNYGVYNWEDGVAFWFELDDAANGRNMV